MGCRGVRPMAELIGRLQPNFGPRVRASPPRPKILSRNHHVQITSRRNHHVKMITRHLAAKSGTSLFKQAAGKVESSSRRNHHVKFKPVAGKSRIITSNSRQERWRRERNASKSITRPTNWDLNSPCFTRGEAAQLAIHRHK